MIQTGSFGMGQGVDPIQQAMQARQQGGEMPPQLEQTMGNPNVPPQVPAGAPNATPQMSDPGVSAPKPPTTEAELIIKAMSQRLGSISKVEQAGIQPPSPQTPAFSPEGAGMNNVPMGGGGYYR